LPFDGQVARLDKELAYVARQFVLVRITSMRGVNLEVFDFDYDLTWMAFFLNADSKVLGRYGGRDADSAESRMSLVGLRHALQAALDEHRAEAKREAHPRAVGERTVEEYPAVKRLSAKACVHCHQVYDFRREALQAKGEWKLDEVWVYPLPENVGVTLELDRGNVVASVAEGSPADRLGVRKGDEIRRVNGQPVASFADFQWALHRATDDTLEIDWRRAGQDKSGKRKLPDGWRKTDLSWRWSLRGLDPPPWVHGDDLTAEEKKALGLAEKRLAFRQGNFVTEPARQAGIRQGDVILGIDGKELEMTARQFSAYVRLSYKVGDRVTYNVRRGQERLDLTLKLQGRSP
jgi:hypothetical protein